MDQDQASLKPSSSRDGPPSLSPNTSSAASRLSIDTTLSNKPSPAAVERTPRTSDFPGRRSGSVSSINRSAHRQSFAESLRQGNAPSSPHMRHSSITQIAVQDLLNNPPPSARNVDPKFAGREWRDITVGELAKPGDVQWIEMDGTVEDAAKILTKSTTNTVLIREKEESKAAVSTFDYSDLLSYLLVVCGLSKPEEEHIALFNDLMSKQQMEKPISVREIQPLCNKETLVTLPSGAQLSQAVEILGSGIHRVLITGDDGSVTGLVSQLRVVHFFWNEGVHFPPIDKLYQVVLKDLGVRTQDVISINSDAPLTKALVLMDTEGVTSIAVVDNGKNVVGNISVRDVRHLTSSSSAGLLLSSCMHFISVILNERGMEAGRDAVPVFYVNPYSTLAHTVAKVVATGTHRMWIVDATSPAPAAANSLGPGGTPGGPATTGGLPSAPLSTIPASALAGRGISGKLSGVVSLTDILNIFAKYTGLNPADPGEQRARRRRSSSSSLRPNMDSQRGSSGDLLR